MGRRDAIARLRQGRITGVEKNDADSFEKLLTKLSASSEVKKCVPKIEKANTVLCQKFRNDGNARKLNATKIL